MVSLHNRPSFLTSSSQIGALLRSNDWRRTELGQPEGWPHELKTALQIILNTGHPMYICWGPKLLCFYNDAFSRLIGPEGHPGALGLPAAEVQQEIWSTIGPQIEFVMAGHGSTWRENSLVPITRNGRREEIYWTYSCCPISQAAAPNAIGGVLVICTETTKHVLAERALATHAERQRQQQMFEGVPGFITILTGPDHTFEFVNTAYKKVFGLRNYLGRPVRDVFPEVKGQEFFELLDRVYTTGLEEAPEAVPIFLQNDINADPEVRFINFVYVPIMDSNGTVTGIFCEGMDVTALHAAENHRKILTQELQHRVKNMLGVVQAIVSQSLRSAATPAAVRKAINARLATLAHVHDILMQSSWTEAPIHDLIEGAVTLHCPDRDRVQIQGPAVKLQSQPALALSLALHELFTNAIKYGALSNETGRIFITWSLFDSGADGAVFRMVWQESGGPPVAPPSATGFGTWLTGAYLAKELGNGGETIYAPDGVRWVLSIILGAIRREGALVER